MGPTGEASWLKFLEDIPEWEPPAAPTVLVSPHPDDETLGAGGLIATQTEREVPVSIIAVSDGEAAYPDSPGLGEVRRAEQIAAAIRLGVPPERVISLRFPDSAIAACENRLAGEIAARIDSATLLVAPWPFDPHPDHEACGRAAVSAARSTGASLVFYLFWTWHRKEPDHLNGLTLRRLEVTCRLQERRAQALACHTSQLERANGLPILPDPFLAPARRSFETFIFPDCV